jgi:hypothetical protein
MGVEQMGHVSRAVLLVAVMVSMLAVAPARAEPIPTAKQDSWGHFVGCFSVLLDSITHAMYCGPSAVPFSNESLMKSEPPSPPPPPPSCGPCSGPTARLDPTGEVLVADLSEHWLPPKRARIGWLLLACCPIGNS